MSTKHFVETLEQHHRALDEEFKALASGICCCAGTEDLKQAKERLDRVARGLLEHIRFEEEDLFPIFEAASGISAGYGPTAVMRAEHDEFKAALSEASQTLQDGNTEAFEQVLNRLIEGLSAHNMKEEHMLYPAIGAVADADATERLSASASKRLAG